MKKNILLYALKLGVFLLIGGSLICLHADNAKSEAKVEYIEQADGEKVPAVEDPCTHGTAKEEAEEFVAKYIEKKWNLTSVITEAKEVISEIKAKHFNDIGHLSTIIERSLYLWACKNEYKIHNTRSLGFYFFKKDIKANKGVFIGTKADGYLPSEGIRKGSASLALDKRGRMGDTYYLQVVITKINPQPNEKYSTELNDEAKEILDKIVDYSYIWGLEYFNTLIEKAK